MPDVTTVDFHFDVLCPYAYQTSKWIREVRDQTDLTIEWKFFSLEEINRVDGVPADIPFYTRMISSVGASVGYDHGSPVSSRYSAPFPFTGTLHEVVIQLPHQRDAGDADATARAEMSRQ